MRVTMNWAKIATLTAALALLPSLAEARQAVKIGLGAPTLSFLPIWSRRALDTFKPQGLTATVAALPGGDASALAALDAGDIDLAAVGPDSMLRAAAKGQPFEIVYSLMSAALKGATFGRRARWPTTSLLMISVSESSIALIVP